MAEVTLKKAWQDIIVDAGVRPNVKMIFSNGIITGVALNTKVMEAIFLWPAVAANASSDFIFLQETIVAGGTQDLVSVNDPNFIVRAGTIIILEVLRGESVPGVRMFKQYPSNQMVGVHPNSNIGKARAQLDQVFGWDYTGSESPFTNPTEVSRVIVAEKLRAQFAYRNPNPFPVRNTTRLILNTIEFMPLDPSITANHARIVAMVKGRVPSVSWSPGLTDSSVQDFPQNFGIKPVQFELDPATGERVVKFMGASIE